MENKLKIIEIIKKDKIILISLILFFVLIPISSEYIAYRFFHIINFIFLIYKLIVNYFSQKKLFWYILSISTLDILLFYFARMSVYTMLVFILTIISIIYTDYSNNKAKKNDKSIEFLVIYLILKSVILLQMLLFN